MRTSAPALAVGGSPIPTPSKDTSRADVSALDGMERLAIFEPADVGEKTTSTVQLSEGANTCPGQILFQMVNADGSTSGQPIAWQTAIPSPVMVIVPSTRSVSPVFEMVKVLDADVLPISTLPKLWEVGETEMSG